MDNTGQTDYAAAAGDAKLAAFCEGLSGLGGACYDVYLNVPRRRLLRRLPQ